MNIFQHIHVHRPLATCECVSCTIYCWFSTFTDFSTAFLAHSHSFVQQSICIWYGICYRCFYRQYCCHHAVRSYKVSCFFFDVLVHTHTHARQIGLINFLVNYFHTNTHRQCGATANVCGQVWDVHLRYRNLLNGFIYPYSKYHMPS